MIPNWLKNKVQILNPLFWQDKTFKVCSHLVLWISNPYTPLYLLENILFCTFESLPLLVLSLECPLSIPYPEEMLFIFQNSVLKEGNKTCVRQQTTWTQTLNLIVRPRANHLTFPSLISLCVKQ